MSRSARGDPASGSPRASGDARRVALEVLVRVDAEGAYANVVLNGVRVVVGERFDE